MHNLGAGLAREELGLGELGLGELGLGGSRLPSADAGLP